MRKLYYPLLVILILFSAAASAQQVLTAKNLFDIRSAVETAVSPDGKLIAYTVARMRPLDHTPGSDYRDLYVYNIASKQSSPILNREQTLNSIAWSPDSKSILFIAALDGEKISQVYSVDASGGSPKKITSASGSVRKFELNPSGSKLAYVFAEPLTRIQQNKEKGFDAEIYEEDYSDLNLNILDLQSGNTNKITANTSVFDFHWSPDGSSIAAAMADKNLIDYEYMYKRLYMVDPQNGSRRTIIENPGKLGSFAFSPDGKKLAFVSASDINDAVSGSLFIVDLPNDKAFTSLLQYSKDFEGSVTGIAWKNDNSLIFSAEEGVDITLSRVTPGSAERTLLLQPGQVVFSGFDINGSVISFAGSTPQHPSELFVYNIDDNKLSKLSSHNSWLDNYSLGKQEKITYEARDGLKIEGLLTYPVGYEEGKSYPLINYIHGGPEAAVHNGWMTSYGSWGQIAAGEGYFVFAPNYRGSSGRGVAFSKMDFGDLADEEFNDVLDGIDYLVEKGYVNKSKVGIGGGSYGGYFAAWAATKHSDRFAASVVFVGISNQISKRNTTDIPTEDYHVHWGMWTHEDVDLVYDRSPVKYAGQSKTPTLILHGKEDPRVHPSQSLELYRTLKLQGKAPVRLVFYPGQGHGNSKNTSKYDFAVRTLNWFNYYLKGNNPKDQMPDKYINYE